MKPWKFRASLTVLNGSSDAFLTGDATVATLEGWANFTTLGVSHAGTYRITIQLSSPQDAVGRYNPVSFTVTVSRNLVLALLKYSICIILYDLYCR